MWHTLKAFVLLIGTNDIRSLLPALWQVRMYKALFELHHHFQIE